MVYMLFGKLSSHERSRGNDLNKQRFLTELKRLLVFMTDSDRDLTIARYSDMFDAAGEDGEQAVIEKLGSPTKLAISLSRGYEPGQLTSEHKQRQALKKAEKAAKTVKSQLHGIEDYTPGTQFDGEEKDPVAIILKSLEQDFTEEEDAEEEEPEEELIEEEPEEEEGPVTVYKRLDRPMPVGLGATLLTLILLVVGLPAAAVGLVLLVLCLLPGAAGVICAGLSAIAALWCIGQIANALLLFGLAFLLLGLGLVIFWLGLRLDIRLVKLYIRGIAVLCDALLGKKVAVE